MSTTVSPGNFDKLSLRLKMKAKETYSYVRQNAEKSKIQKKTSTAIKFAEPMSLSVYLSRHCQCPYYTTYRTAR